jgi:hypothetical protein
VTVRALVVRLVLMAGALLVVGSGCRFWLSVLVVGRVAWRG